VALELRDDAGDGTVQPLERDDVHPGHRFLPPPSRAWCRWARFTARAPAPASRRRRRDASAPGATVSTQRLTLGRGPADAGRRVARDPAALDLHATRFGATAAPVAQSEAVAVEEPLEIRVGGEPLAVTMRTPGDDVELALGFLFAEGVIASRDDVGSAAHCGVPGEEGHGNVIDVLPAPGRAFDLERTGAARRGTPTTAACGVCGRRSIDDLVARCGALADAARFARGALAGLADRLRAEQPGFARTGGLHAAGLAGGDGAWRIVREDVGRHNAVDKVVGRLLLDRALPGRGLLLVVSGRASFEIVQKAVTAGIPAVVSVSAPTSLAVATARRAGLTLIGFARDGAFTAYAGVERIG
jgi:FdhD protein